MASFLIDIQGDVLTVGFNSNEPAQNNVIVRDATVRIDGMKASGKLPGGSIIKINGPASLPVAVAIAHGLLHLYETVAVFDPKLGRYVVAVCHSNLYLPGDLID
ncbi:MAG: CRISPR-associated protein Csx3 [Patescibacteria group bacterium]